MKKFYILLLLSNLINAQSIEIKNPFVTTQELETIFFLDENNGWIGAEGSIFRTTDAGNTWHSASFGIQAHVYAISAFNKNIAIVYTFNGSNNDVHFNSFRSTDGGITWKEIIFPVQITSCAPQIFDSLKGIIASSSAVIKTYDAGNSWVVLNQDTSIHSFPSISFLDENTGWMSRAGIWKTTDGGINWQLLSNVSGWSLKFFTSTLGYIQTDFEFKKTIDGGFTWTNVNNLWPGARVYFFSPSLIINSYGYPNGDPFYPRVQKSTDGGYTWTTIYNHKRYGINSVFFVNDSVGYLGGEDGYMAKTTNGSNFISINGDYLYAVSSDRNIVFLAGEFGKIYRSINYGEQWEEIESGTERNIRSIDFLDSTNVLAFTDDLPVLRSNDGGAHWTQNQSELYLIRDYQILDSHTIWVATLPGYYFKSTDAGASWIKKFFPDSLNSIYFLNDSVGYLSGFLNMYKTTDGGENWSAINNVLYPERKMKFLNEQTGYGLAYGLLKTTDGGINWAELYSDYELEAYTATYPEMSKFYVLFSPGDEPRFDSHINFEKGTFKLHEFDQENRTRLTFGTGYIKPAMDFATSDYGWIAAGRMILRIGLDSTLTNLERVPLNKKFVLQQNYPNPFNPSTTISYSIPEKTEVVIKVFDILGSELETIVDEEKVPGEYKLNWNAAGLPSGVYFCQLRAGNFIQTMKMMLLR